MTEAEPSGPATPEAIERLSFRIIREELDAMGVTVPDALFPVVGRVIHATADFEFARNLVFSEGAVRAGSAALREGRPVVTDTRMAWSGVNKRALRRFGGRAHCLIADPGVARAARAAGCTRSRAAVDKAAGLWPEAVYAVGNAPTALLRICELVREGRLRPRLVVGVPVGFVNVAESKDALLRLDIPHIVAAGRKGGSAVAAAIVNALLYGIPERVPPSAGDAAV